MCIEVKGSEQVWEVEVQWRHRKEKRNLHNDPSGVQLLSQMDFSFLSF